MIENLPLWINALFIFSIFYTISIFYLSNNKPKKVVLLIVIWSVVQSVFAYSGFYQKTDGMPPRFLLVILPVLCLIIYSLLPKQRESIIRNRNTKVSTFLHTVRIPIELVLFQLFIHHQIPELMTFEGRNFDIIAGITAPIIGLLFWKNGISKNVLIGWNIIALCMVVFIFVNALLSAELPIQQFGFEQPNKAVLHFPFILLPATIVPIVIWTHLTDIMKLLKADR